MPTPLLPLGALLPVLAMISVTPQPILFHLGPIPVYWYGICYAVGIAVSYIVITREARRRGLDATLVDNAIIIVAAAALIGGRAYHVIDQWSLYKDDLFKIVQPPYTGLGVYGGILTGTLAAWYLVRRWKQPFWRWADIVAPGLFVMQAIGRWGNFFNQELYGPPTNLPWGIAIDCAHRVGDHGIAQWPCTDFPEATTAFQPLFLYESVSGVLGAVTLLWIARRYGRRMRPGDLFLMFVIWYSIVRFWLETFRTGNWTFFGIPTAMLVAAVAIVGAVAVLLYRHRPGTGEGDRWGEPPVRDTEEEWLEDDEAADARADDLDDEAAGSLDEDEDEDADGEDQDRDGEDAGDGGSAQRGEGGDGDWRQSAGDAGRVGDGGRSGDASDV